MSIKLDKHPAMYLEPGDEVTQAECDDLAALRVSHTELLATLRLVLRDMDHPNFTDRHGIIPIIKVAIERGGAI